VATRLRTRPWPLATATVARFEQAPEELRRRVTRMRWANADRPLDELLDELLDRLVHGRPEDDVALVAGAPYGLSGPLRSGRVAPLPCGP
jgi:hypothetical protein